MAYQTARLLLLAGLSLASAAGCEKREGVSHYRAPKPVPLEDLAAANPHAGMGPHAGLPNAPQGPAQPPGEPTDRMLGAIVPVGSQSWFFKLMGPKDRVASLNEDFLALIKGLRFTAEGNPQWKLPEGWREEPASAMRYATFIIPGEGKPLELTVTKLGSASGTLANVNRWRGQMQLSPIAEEQLAGDSSQLALEGGQTATFVNLLGTAAATTMGRPGSMPGARDGN